MKPNLVFFTSEYPFGKSETFIENEIQFLSDSFSQILIIPARSFGSPRDLPHNCEILSDLYKDDGYNRNQLLVKYPFQICELFYSEIRRHHNKVESKTDLFSRCLRLHHKAFLLEKLLKERRLSNVRYYSYWMDEWTTVLGILKSKGVIKNYFARAHGFDLFENRREKGYIPFRQFQLKHIREVFSVSKEGQLYLQKEYPRYFNKFKVFHLGTIDHGLNSIYEENNIHLLSVSNVISLKRLHLIIEILRGVKKDIRWTHFGDGKLMENIVSLSESLPRNVKVQFIGRKSNKEVYDFLQNTAISFFINVSDTEGLPVSIMEATSFGIPIIATDVGGVKEIVNKNTGILLDKSFKPSTVSEILDNFPKSMYRTKEYKMETKRYWKENFSAMLNYPKFIDHIVSLKN